MLSAGTLRARRTFGVLGALGVLAWLTHRHPHRVERRYQPGGQILDLGGPTHVLQGGQPDGPPVVLIHGSDGVALDWQISPLWDKLAGVAQVTAYDRPGHGHSPVPPGEAVTVEANVRRLSAVLDALGIMGPVTLLGHSYGAAVALEFAAVHPGRVAGLVLFAPTAFAVPGLTRPLAYLTLIPGIEALLTRLLLLPLGVAVAHIEGHRAFSPARVPPVWRDMMLAFSRRRMQVHALAWENRTLGRELAQLSRRYPSLKVPVTVLAGVQDRLTAPHLHAAPLARALPNATLHLVQGAGHQLHWTHPDLILQAVQGLLSEGEQGDT